LAAGYFFENLKGPHPLNGKKSVLKTYHTKCGLSISWAAAANN
jgi:hypothetical protein